MNRRLARVHCGLLTLLLCASCGAPTAGSDGQSPQPGVVGSSSPVAAADADVPDADATAQQDTSGFSGPEVAAVGSTDMVATDVVAAPPSARPTSVPQPKREPESTTQPRGNAQVLGNLPVAPTPIDEATCDLRHPARFTRITERHRGWFDAVKESLHDPCPEGDVKCDGPTRCRTTEDPVSVGRWVVAERGEIQVEFSAHELRDSLGKKGRLGRLDITGRIVRRDGSAPAIEVPGYSEINMKAALGDDDKARQLRVEVNAMKLEAIISEFKYNQMPTAAPNARRLDWLVVRVLNNGSTFTELSDDLAALGEHLSDSRYTSLRAIAGLGAALSAERQAIYDVVLEALIAAIREVVGAAAGGAATCQPSYNALALRAHGFSKACDALDALNGASCSIPPAKADIRHGLAKDVQRALDEAIEHLRSQPLKPQWLSEAAAACVADAGRLIPAALRDQTAQVHNLTLIPIVTTSESAFLEQIFQFLLHDQDEKSSFQRINSRDAGNPVGPIDVVRILREAWNERAVAGMRDVRLQPSQLGAKRGDIIELTVTYVPFGARGSPTQQQSSAGGGANGTAPAPGRGEDGALGETRPSRWIIQFPVDRKGLYLEPDARLSLVSSWDYQPKAVTNRGAIGATTIGVGLDARWYMSPYDSRLERFGAFLVSGIGLGVDTLHFQTNSGTEFGIEGHVDLFSNILSYGVGYDISVWPASRRNWYWSLGLGVKELFDRARELVN